MPLLGERDYVDGTPATTGTTCGTEDVLHLPELHRQQPVDGPTESQKGQRSGFSCKAPLDALCCLVLVLIAPVIAVTVMSMYMASSHNRTSHALVFDPDVATACGDDSARCHNITLYLMDSLNSLVSPCSDFHKNVCGWWKEKVAHRGPYHDFHIKIFNHRVARELVARAETFLWNSSGTQASLENQMAVFFASCSLMRAGFDKEGDFTQLLTTLGLSIHEWTNSDNFGGLLELVVATTLRTGLPSFIRVLFFRGEAFRIDVGETLGSTFSYNDREARENVLNMLDDFGDELDSAQVGYSGILAVDELLQSLVDRRNDLTWSVLRSAEDLKSLAENVAWMRALESGLPARLKSEQRKNGVEVKGVDALRKVLERLRQHPLPRFGGYSLVVLLAQVTKYVPSLGYETSLNAPTPVAKCLHLTAMLFDQLYPVWVARTFQHAEQVAGARTLLDHIAATLRKEPVVNRGLLIDTSRLNKARLVTYDEVSAGSPPMTPLDATLGASFFHNMAAVTAAKVGEHPTPVEYWQHQVNGYVGYRADGNFLISSAYLSDMGIYMAVTVDKELTAYLQYATLGTFILRAIFDSDATKYFPSWAQDYIKECFARSASSVLGMPVNTRLATAIMRFRWSVQLAWFLKSRRLRENDTIADDAYFEELPSATTPRSRTTMLKKLFFRLVCFTECGDFNASDLCNDLAGFDHHFAHAFHCPKKTARHVGECDCPGLDRCKTYLPLRNETNNDNVMGLTNL